MNKAIFLDRDGVLNRENGNYISRLEEFIINDGVFEGLKYFQQKDYLLIVITNQGGISKGMYDHEDVDKIHNYLREKLEQDGIKITAIYYCPHHPVRSKCICRKPDSLMLEKAMARFNIDAARSYFIGDHDRDIEAGKKTGLQTIKIIANSSLLEVKGLIK